MREYRIQAAPSSRQNRVGAHVWVDSYGRMVSYNGGVMPRDMLGLHYIDCGCGDLTAGAYLLRPVEHLAAQSRRKESARHFAVYVPASNGSGHSMHYCTSEAEAFACARSLVGGATKHVEVIQLVGTVSTVTNIQETRY